MRITANKPDAMSRIPFAQRYASERGSVLAGAPYAAAADEGATRKRPPQAALTSAAFKDARAIGEKYANFRTYAVEGRASH
jgi:hypothetical protein